MDALLPVVRGQIANQRGLVLYTALLLLSLIMAVGVQAILSTRSNLQITSNLQAESLAFYLSEAGIEWSKSELHRSTSHPPALSIATQTISAGTFSVATISSVAVSNLLAKVVVRSDGRYGPSLQIIEVELLKRYQLADAALMLRGYANSAQFTSDLFSISGADHDPQSGQAIANTASQHAITVTRPELANQLEAQLSPSQMAHISGAGRDGAAISSSEFLPAAAIAQLSEILCSTAQAVSIAVPAAETVSVSNQNWGSRAAPELRCINGDAGPGDSITLGGNSSGAGLLVVRDANLVLDGNFKWEGLIIVTGSKVSLGVLGSGAKEIFGAVIINEADTSSETHPPSLQLQGALRILFSRSALAGAAVLAPADTLAPLYPSLPREIVQNYWRVITS